MPRDARHHPMPQLAPGASTVWRSACVCAFDMPRITCCNQCTTQQLAQLYADEGVATAAPPTGRRRTVKAAAPAIQLRSHRPVLLHPDCAPLVQAPLGGPLPPANPRQPPGACRNSIRRSVGASYSSVAPPPRNERNAVGKGGEGGGRRPAPRPVPRRGQLGQVRPQRHVGRQAGASQQPRCAPPRAGGSCRCRRRRLQLPAPAAPPS